VRCRFPRVLMFHVKHCIGSGGVISRSGEPCQALMPKTKVPSTLFHVKQRL